METSAETELKRLLRGVSTDHAETVRDAWRALRGIGPGVVPALLTMLDRPVWAERAPGPSARYLGVMLSLLASLDRRAFASEIDRLRASDLHPHHRLTVDILAPLGTDVPVAKVGPGVSVHVAGDVPDPDRVTRRLAAWSRICASDLGSVQRIDVVLKRPEMDYAGRYNIHFSGIILAWSPVPPGPRRRQQHRLRLWWEELSTEFTFYHEVGHHACGHLEGGQVADQEQEADEYARSRMRVSRPVLTGLGRALLLPLKLALRVLAPRAYARVKREIRG